MATFSLKEMASSKELNDVRRGDLYKIDPRFLKEEEGFNLRNYDTPEVKAHIESLTESMLSGGYIPPVVVRTDGKGSVFLVDGHCRRRAALAAIERGAEGLMLSAVNFKGSDADRVELMLRSDEGLKFSPLETAHGYLRLNRMGLSVSEVAKKVGKSLAHVSQYITLATSNMDVQNLVAEEKISAHTAITTLQKHGDDSGEVLRKQLDAAEKNGDKKVTTGTMRPWIPPRDTVVDLVEIAKEVEKNMSFEGDDGLCRITLTPEQADKLMAIMGNINDAEEKKRNADARKAQKAAAQADTAQTVETDGKGD